MRGKEAIHLKLFLKKWLCPLLPATFLCCSGDTTQVAGTEHRPQYTSNPFVIQLAIPAPTNTAGGIIAADLDNDGFKDYLVTVPDHVAAYANNGRKLWISKTDVRVSRVTEEEGLPGHHGPGVQAADIDGDGRTEVLYLTQDSVLYVLDGLTGHQEFTAKPPLPVGAERWEHAVVADFSGEGDRDLLLQATNKKGYRVGRYLAAYRIKDLRRKKFDPIWTRDDFLSTAHSGARVADLDGDGKDEVLGQTLLSPHGQVINEIYFDGKSHADYVSAADVLPGIPGLEVVVLEEELREGERIGSVYLVNSSNMIWRSHHERQEPQNAAVGEFDLGSPGLEIWCRSRHDRDQSPFVFSSDGKLLSEYDFRDVAPAGWTKKGVEVIWTIDWTGGPKQLAAAKERHTTGDVAVFDPLTGEFLHRIDEDTDRLYVADVSGDWREELIVLSGSELHIYHNDEPNEYPERERLWANANYRRSKVTWNYYNP